jgi:CubicO group peptidase (beta-lactamase class C family)
MQRNTEHLFVNNLSPVGSGAGQVCFFLQKKIFDVKIVLLTTYLLLFIALTELLIPGCTEKSVSSDQKLVDCISRNKLTKEQEAHIRKEIHASEKSFSLDTLFKRKAKYLGFNGSVLIAQKGIILYKAAFGYADFVKKDSLCLNSAFQLASISKTFTGTAILLLAQDKKLKLSDSIQQYIPGFPYHGITIENLLSHRSGLPNYLYCFEEKRKKNIAAPTNDTILKWFSETDSLPKPYNLPGRSFNYNNTNFILLASVVEKVSQMSYAEFIRTRIFEPLGMNHSFIDTIAPDSLRFYRTYGHQGNKRREREFFDGVYGDKGIFSTVGDMEQWYFALHSGCLLNKHWLKEAFTPRSFERKSRHNYGLGFRLMTDPENMNKVNYVYHGGWWAGYSTMFWMDMKSDIVIIVLGNRKNNSVYDIKSIISILEDNTDTGLENINDGGN